MGPVNLSKVLYGDSFWGYGFGGTVFGGKVFRATVFNLQWPHKPYLPSTIALNGTKEYKPYFSELHLFR